jgi:hypothetical protein
MTKKDVEAVAKLYGASTVAISNKDKNGRRFYRVEFLDNRVWHMSAKSHDEFIKSVMRIN